MTNNFFQRVYNVVREIPAGKVATYKLIADKVRFSAHLWKPQ